jgi:hypothetical protein
MDVQEDVGENEKEIKIADIEVNWLYSTLIVR